MSMQRGDVVLADLPYSDRTGLLRTSVVKCEHLITLHQHSIGRVIGHLSPKLMERVDHCLKESLGLS
jgi:mRNA-degrading endonuclease toxin of MazEF toxin-antitoxin module